ncbi:mechanosensitive ion channel family protein [Niveispirillum fermenti]|uniref:mechanosensitive ion channel family protein n=1 Tax=Niveispirillum fermenti TaxID=1233113 RepID=UPI003A86F67A
MDSDYFHNLIAENADLIRTLIGLTILILAAWITNSVVKKLVLRLIQRGLSLTRYGSDEALASEGLIPRLANVMPALVIMAGINLVPGLPDAVVLVVRNVCAAFIILTLALAVSAALNIVTIVYSRRPDAHRKPIKGYVQLVKLVVFAIATILVIAALMDRSPLILLSGVGALAAVLMLVFQDTLLSLVASVQISSGDMVRVGDWIEMPQMNADGDVIDIALHTVKVQNWDKTITTLPTRKLISEPFKNWRGMQESGGRRIKRSLFLDQNSVRFLNPQEIENLHNFKVLAGYLDSKQQEIAQWNATLGKDDEYNIRRLTNLGTFRAYLDQYLRQHPGIHQGMTILVRHLAPGSEGLPMEIYCFTNDTAWGNFEAIQADIFDHLLAILPEFGLRVFQSPGGSDLQQLNRLLAMPPLHAANEGAGAANPG